MNRPSYAGLLACIATLFAAPAIASHPYHVSLCEMEFNPRSGNMEVALCVWPADLELALSRDTGKKVDLDSTTELDQKIAAYLEKRLRVMPAMGGKTCPIRMVGHEHNLKQAWIYLEFTNEHPTTEWTVDNRVFFELNADQLNQLNFKAPCGKQYYSLNSDQPTVRLQVNQAARN